MSHIYSCARSALAVFDIVNVDESTWVFIDCLPSTRELRQKAKWSLLHFSLVLSDKTYFTDYKLNHKSIFKSPLWVTFSTTEWNEEFVLMNMIFSLWRRQLKLVWSVKHLSIGTLVGKTMKFKYLKVELRMWMLKNRKQRKIYGHEKDVLPGGWKNLHKVGFIIYTCWTLLRRWIKGDEMANTSSKRGREKKYLQNFSRQICKR